MENEPWSPKMSVCLVILGRLQLWRHSGFNFNARTNQKVCSDQHSAGAGSKLPHDHVTLLLVHVAMLKTENFVSEVQKGRREEYKGSAEGDTRAETVKSLACIFSVSQSTFLLVLRKMTAWVIVSVSYRSHRVSSFHSWRQKSKPCKTPKSQLGCYIHENKRVIWHRALRQKTLDIKKEVPPLSHFQPCAFVLLPWCTRAYMATWAKPVRSGSCSSSRVLLVRRLAFHSKIQNHTPLVPH